MRSHSTTYVCIMYRQHPKSSDILRFCTLKVRILKIHSYIVHYMLQLVYLLKLLSDHCTGTSLLINETAIESQAINVFRKSDSGKRGGGFSPCFLFQPEIQMKCMYILTKCQNYSIV